MLIRLALSCTLFCIIAFSATAQTPIKNFVGVSKIFPFGDNVLLVANDDIHGEELWISDKTPEGTQMLKDIQPDDFAGSSISYLTNFKGKAYFSAYSPFAGGELWSTDGTSAGTIPVTNLSNPRTSDGLPRNLTVFNDNLFFVTYKGELYKTNGDVGNAELIDAGFSSAAIRFLTVAAGKLYYYNNGFRFTNGSSKSELPSPVDPDNLILKNLFSTGNQLYQLCSNSIDTRFKLYVLDQNTNAWLKLLDVQSPSGGYLATDNFTPFNGKLVFTIRRINQNTTPADEFWISDGTIDGTKMLKSFAFDNSRSGSEMTNFSIFNNEVYFRSSSGANKALWKSDGSVAGTVKVHDLILLESSSTKNPPVVLNNRLYLAASTVDAISVGSLWSTDGTEAGTRFEFSLRSNLGSMPFGLTRSGDELVFVTSSGTFSTSLWSSAPAAEINVIEADSNQEILVDVGLGFSMVSVNGCSSRTVRIKNDGGKSLALGAAEVIGSDFWLEGTLPEALAPGESVTIKVWLYPSTQGIKTGTLTLLSGDENEGTFNITLGGQVVDPTAPVFCNAFNDTFARKIIPTKNPGAIRLSNSSVKELMPAGTLVGALSMADNSSATFSFVDGQGDTHNKMFTISGAELKSKKQFVFADANFYTIRVKATRPDQSTTEATYTIEIENQLDAGVQGDCKKRVERLDYGISDVAVNSVGNIFEVTTIGKIQRSDDGGISWREIDPGFTEALSTIFFKGSTGYVLGKNSVLKSEDNGDTWFQLYVPTSEKNFAPSAAFFFDDNTGYITGDAGSFHFTSDGGKSWETRSTSAYGSTTFNGLWFFSKEKGIAISGSADVIKTVDGGRTWTRMDLSSAGFVNTLTDIWFLNDNEGFILSFFELLYTTNGGTSWQVVRVPDDYLGSLMNIQFVDDKKGFMFGGAVKKTIDGGKTWTDTPTGAGGAVTSGAIYNGKIYASYAIGGKGRAMSVTSDEGQTWQQLHALNGDERRAISFPTDKVGFVCSQYNSSKTTNGGITWRSVSWNTPMSQVVFLDENIALFSDDKSIYKSTDGGESISPVLTGSTDPNNYKPVGKLYAVTKDIVFSYRGGIIYRSIDGGSTWTFKQISGVNSETVMHFASPNVGYLVTYFGGGIYKTIDGGVTWTNIYPSISNASITYRTIYFVNEQLGFKAGDRFEKTTDGGQTWQTLFLSFNNVIMNLFFTSDVHGLAVCTNGETYETFDGGLSWQRIAIFSIDAASDVKFNNGGIYVAAKNGVLAQYKNPQVTPLIPGYIVGKQTVCVGDAQTYKLANNPTGEYLWSIPGAKVKDNSSSVEVYFPTAGDYAFTVNGHNTCGTTASRMLVVKAESLAVPLITGSEKVAAPAQTSYVVSNIDPKVTYSWGVTPQASFQVQSSTSGIAVQWPAKNREESVSVIGNNPQNGCRIRGTNLKVLLSANVPAPPQINDTTVYRCNRTIVLTAKGEHIQWFQDVEATRLLASGTFSPVASQKVYVTQTVGGIQGDVAIVNITIIDRPTKPVVTPGLNLTLCEGTESILVQATGQSVNWYSDESLLTKVASGSSVTATNSATYFVTQTIQQCQSLSTKVIVDRVTIDSQIKYENGKIFTGEQSADSYEWLRNGQVVKTGTNTFDYNGVEGTYSLTIKKRGCEEQSEPFLITGLEETAPIAVFPNPATYEVKIVATPGDRIFIYDVGGAVTFENTNVVTAETYLPTSQWKRGLYAVVITHRNQTMMTKLVLE